jgi:hypothetical protein
MATNSKGHALSRATTILLAGLMVLSTVLFVAGVALERSSLGPGDTHPSTPQVAPTVSAGAEAPEGSEAREAQERQEAAATVAPEGSEAREAQERQEAAAAASPESAEGTPAHEAAEQNRVFGIDVESPWVITSVVILTLLLIAALFLLGERVLPLVVLVAVVATVFDLREAGYQLGQARYLIAALAIGVVASRIATAVVAWLAWRQGAQPAPSTGAS